MRTTNTDTHTGKLRLVPDKPPDTRPNRRQSPVQLRRPGATVAARPVGRPPAPEVVDDLTHRPRTRTYWAVAFTALGQLALAAAIALGGDPIMGAAAAVLIAICGLALIVAEVTTNRSAEADEAAQPREAQAANGGGDR